MVRRTLLALTLGAMSILVAACGTGVASPGVASMGATTTTTLTSTAGSGATNDGAELRYSECMRANGVPNFPDPNSSGGFEIAGISPRSPIFQSAQKKCATILPGGGPPGPGTTTNPSPAAMAAMLKISECMRAHGVANFPDPTTAVPENLPGGGVVSDRDGVILVLPNSLDMQSSPFRRAAKACNFAMSNH